MIKYEPINYGTQTKDSLELLIDVSENSIYNDEKGKLYIYKNGWVEYQGDTPPVLHSLKTEDFIDESTPFEYKCHNPSILSDVNLDYVINHTQETISEAEEDNKDEL